MGNTIKRRTGGMEMKKKIFLTAVFTFAVLFNSFAGGKKIKVGRNQVAVISKVSVKTNSDLSYFEKAFGCTEEDIARPSNYFFPKIFPKKGTYYAADVIEFEEIAEAEDGQYCVAIYDLPSDRTLYFASPIRYLYHKLYVMDIALPTGFKVQVPEGVKCIYIGDLNYTVSTDYFEVTGFKISDTYDSAVEFLKSIPGLEAEKLCRVELSSITEDDAENYNFKCAIDTSKGGKRFTMVNGVYTYKK